MVMAGCHTCPSSLQTLPFTPPWCPYPTEPRALPPPYLVHLVCIADQRHSALVLIRREPQHELQLHAVGVLELAAMVASSRSK